MHRRCARLSTLCPGGGHLETACTPCSSSQLSARASQLPVSPGQTRFGSGRKCTERCKDPEPRSQSPPHHRTPLGAPNPSVEMVPPHLCPPAARNTRLGAAERASNDKIRNWCVQRRGVPPRAVWWRSCAKDYLETAYAPLSVLSAPHRTLQPAHASPLAA